MFHLHILGLYSVITSFTLLFTCRVTESAIAFRPVHTEAFIREIGARNGRFHGNSKAKLVEKDVDPELEPWKRDLAEIPGAWNFFLPNRVTKAEGFDPAPGTRPFLLFCDISGRVSGPEMTDSPKGSFILDAKPVQLVDDGVNFIHSRKFVIVLTSYLQFSNLRLVLAGRLFYSKNNVVDAMAGIVKLRSAIFVGQTFVESYDNAYAKETLTRLERKLVTYDNEGNEVDPLTWKFQELEAPGSPFRWMHGNNEWKLLGPFVAYKSLGGRPPLKEKLHMFEKFNMKDLYNIVDPFEHTCKRHTAIQDLEEETHDLISRVFKPNDKLLGNISIQSPEYIKELENELIQLGTQGPNFYKKTLE